MYRPAPTPRPRISALMLALAVLAPSPAAIAQMGGGEQLNKLLSNPETDPAKIEEMKKERQRAPIEFFRSQVLPNDVLPYIKANHWSMVGLEMRANHEDYAGSIQSRPVMLAGQPHEIVFRRDVLLKKAARSRVTLPILLPGVPKEIGFQLIRPDAIRQDEEWLASLRVLEPHQQMVIVLSKNANDHYNRWSQYRAVLPSAARRDDPIQLEKLRYYRMVLPLEPDKPMLSSHPLTWSPISHVIWDGMAPELIGVAQQQAMVDWLHWGGQLVIVGGAGPAFAPLRESFLGPYLPAEPSGENVSRTGAELKPLSDAYPPTAATFDADDPQASNIPFREVWRAIGKRYRPPAPILTAPKKPIYVAALRPKPGASTIPLGGPGDPPLGVEWRVGRGRVLMLAVSLSDPDLSGWAGFDTMVRRVVLRRPEERMVEDFGHNPSGAGGFHPPRFEPLVGTELTQVRYLARDLGAPTRRALDEDNLPTTQGYTVNGAPADSPYAIPVGEWLDSAALPDLGRDKLEKASGIEIPGRMFVLKVILAYIFALIPLNWAICRYLLRRRELAWIVVPTLSLAFAIGVERAAAYDVGYDSSCDEVDLIETQGDYPRGHVSRFASLYSTGRVKFSISYPNDPTALALPLATGRTVRGEDVTQSSFQTQPVPALTGFQVQPRSLGLFRAEQMANLPGTVTITPAGQGPRTVENGSGLDLNDAWVVEVGAPSPPPTTSDPDPGYKLKAVALGPIAAGAKVPLGAIAEVEPRVGPGAGQLEPGPFLDLLLRNSVASGPEEVGELRLIAWSGKPLPGQVIEPAVDRHRGFTLMVAHLEPAPLPDPASLRYNAVARGPERMPKEVLTPQPDPSMTPRRGIRGSMMPGIPAPTAPAPPVITVEPMPAPTPAQPEPDAPAPPNPNAPEAARP